MSQLIRYSIRKIFLFSFILSLFFSFVVSQIELLDYIERKGKDFFTVFCVSILSYFPEIFILTLPISSLRFFRERRERINQLETFGFSRKRLIVNYFIVSIVIFSPLNFVGLGIFSSDMKLKLKVLKGDQKKEVVILEGDKIIFVRRMELGRGEERFEISKLSFGGRVLEKKEESTANLTFGKKTLRDLMTRGGIKKSTENPIKYFFFTILVVITFLASVVFGLSSVDFMISLAITLIALSLCIITFGIL